MLILISLKAGGHGLNLTAADYVFILDPWWNPAVEAQAVDRAHRIGQDKPVFAYRLICKDTVEEKIVQLPGRLHLAWLLLLSCCHGPFFRDRLWQRNNGLLTGMQHQDQQ